MPPNESNVLAETLETPAGPAIPLPLDEQQVDAFEDRGYLVLPSFLPPGEVEALIGEVDRWTGSGLRDASVACAIEAATRKPPAVMELELAHHGWLISHPPLMRILEQLLGPVFAFHHMHSSRHDPGLPGKSWHHDFEQHPQTSRTHAMIHAFHYLSGLNGTVGDLVLLPSTHRIVAGKDGLSHAGTQRLYGEVVIDDLPPGSTVIVHSALFHARRPRTGGDDRSRYFIDAAYCQGGTVWPPVKPYWTEMLARARELGLDRGLWPELFSARHFYEPAGHWPLLADRSCGPAASS
jgi:phytanoyl-CoA dioxygenase PhyH